MFISHPRPLLDTNHISSSLFSPLFNRTKYRQRSLSSPTFFLFMDRRIRGLGERWRALVTGQDTKNQKIMIVASHRFHNLMTFPFPIPYPCFMSVALGDLIPSELETLFLFSYMPLELGSANVLQCDAFSGRAHDRECHACIRPFS